MKPDVSRLKSILLWACVLIAVIFCGCTKNEVRITFELPAEVNSPCRIVYYASDRRGGMMRETVAEITSGKGEIVLPQRNPSLIYLFSASSKFPDVVIYARRGEELKVSGNSGNAMEWEAEGNATTRSLTEWRLSNLDALKSRNTDKINAAVKDFIEKNADSEAAAIILYVYFTRRGHEREFAALEGRIAPGVLDEPELMGALSQGDRLTGLPVESRYPPQIILHGEDGFADTLKTGAQGSPSGREGNLLMMFKKGDDYSPGAGVDSIVKLAEENRKGLIAELYAETDSMGWQRHLRHDTLPGVRRMWLPMGLADSLAINMGVRRLPYYIVLDPKGRELYRGDSFSDAARLFSR